MKYAIILITLLFVGCSSLKYSGNKERVKLYVFEIAELNSSYVLKTFNNTNDTVLVVVQKNDFGKENIIKNQTYHFELIRMKVRVPHMQELLFVQPPRIIWGTDTICQCKNLKDCPTTYLFRGIK